MAGSAAPDSRTAEKQHVRALPSAEPLRAKPFLAGTSLNVERGRVEIAIFAGLLASLPVGPGATVLDLGAGACWISEWLQKLKYRTVSLDLCLDMLRIGQERLRPGSWLCAADMARLPLADESVDAAVCYGALHHVPNWPEALREAYRVLRPGGVLLLQEPGRGHRRQPESVAQMQQFGVLEQDLPPAALRRACRRAGFARVVVRPIAELGHGLIRILPPYPFAVAAPKLFLHLRLKRLKAALVESALNLINPLPIVVAAKGRVSADSTRPEAMVARFAAVDWPAAAAAGGAIAFRARVRNTGQTKWLARGRDGALGQVRLGIAWLDGAGRLRALDYSRFELAHDVAPGEAYEWRGSLAAPAEKGPAIFRLDLVSEGVAWFADKGSKPVLRRCVMT